MRNPAQLRLVPSNEIPTVSPRRRRPNADLRTREYLTEGEVDRLIAAAKTNRHGHRDATLVLVGFRHGLRVSELVDLRWDQVDFEAANLHVRRTKRGTPAVHPIQGDTLRALRRLQREQDPKSAVRVHDRARPRRSRSRGCRSWSSVSARRRSSASRCIRTCCGTPAASRWLTPATIRVPFRPISDIARSSTRYATPSWRRIGSRRSGASHQLHCAENDLIQSSLC